MTSHEPIIIVDDDTDDRLVIREVVARLAIRNELREFPNGMGVLKYLRTTREKPFIILCDINMPVMDGLALRKEINNDEFLRSKSIPFVFLTTAANPMQIRKAYDMTVQGFFIKDATFDEMEGTLRCILDYWDQCKHPNSVK